MVVSCAGVAEGWAIRYNGLNWAYASPCSGGCSVADPSNSPGYRFPTSSECANKPSESDFSSSDQDSPYYSSGLKCAAKIFDPIHDHCDSGGQLVCELDTEVLTGFEDLLLVCEATGKRFFAYTPSILLSSKIYL